MALYNEILVARYNRALQKLLGLKGDSPAPQLGADIEPGITLENDRPELGFLLGENWYGADILSPATAAINGRVRIRLATRGVLVVVESIIVTTPTTSQTIQLYKNAVDQADFAGTVAVPVGTDDRVQQGSTGTAVGPVSLTEDHTGTGTNGTVLRSASVLNAVPTEMLARPLVMILNRSPNVPPAGQVGTPIANSYEIRGATVNLDLRVAIRYRVRQAEESEFGLV